MTRILAVARVLARGRRDAVLWPPAILAIAFAVNVAIFATAGRNFGDQPITGALASIYFVCLAFGAVSVNQQFPLTLGLSVTRREFALALSLLAAAQTVVYAIGLTILQAVEQATGGWGIHLRFFGFGLMYRYPVPLQLIMYAVPMLLMTLIGVAIGTLYLRFRVLGLYALSAGATVVLGGGATLLTYYGVWPSVGHWLTTTSPVALIAGWPLVLAAALAACSWTALRRATP